MWSWMLARESCQWIYRVTISVFGINLALVHSTEPPVTETALFYKYVPWLPNPTLWTGSNLLFCIRARNSNSCWAQTGTLQHCMTFNDIFFPKRHVHRARAKTAGQKLGSCGYFCRHNFSLKTKVLCVWSRMRHELGWTPSVFCRTLFFVDSITSENENLCNWHDTKKQGEWTFEILHAPIWSRVYIPS